MLLREEIDVYFSIGEYEKVLLCYSSVLSSYKYDRELYHIISFSAFQRGLFDIALKVISQGLELFPDHFKLLETSLLIDFSIGNIQNILKDIYILRNEKGYNSEYLCNLECQIYVDIKGDYQTAIKLYDKYLNLYGNSPIFLYYQGLLYYKIGDIERSYELFILCLDQDFIYAYYGIVKCMKKMKNINININFFRNKFLTKNDFKNDYTCIANIFYELGLYEIALKLYKKSLRNIPHDYCTYNGIANTFYRLGKYDASILFFGKSLKVRKNDKYALVGLGNNYFKQKQYDKAVQYYEESINMIASSPYSLYKLGLAYYFLAEYQKSLYYIEESLKYDDTNYMAHRYRKKILYAISQ